MVITFEEEHQSPAKKIIILVAVMAVLGGIGYAGWVYFGQQEKGIQGVVPQKVEINWSILKDSRLDAFEPFSEITPIEGDIGKENPFN